MRKRSEQIRRIWSNFRGRASALAQPLEAASVADLHGAAQVKRGPRVGGGVSDTAVRVADETKRLGPIL